MGVVVTARDAEALLWVRQLIATLGAGVTAVSRLTRDLASWEHLPASRGSGGRHSMLAAARGEHSVAAWSGPAGVQDCFWHRTQLAMQALTLKWGPPLKGTR